MENSRSVPFILFFLFSNEVLFLQSISEKTTAVEYKNDKSESFTNFVSNNHTVATIGKRYFEHFERSKDYFSNVDHWVRRQECSVISKLVSTHSKAVNWLHRLLCFGLIMIMHNCSRIKPGQPQVGLCSYRAQRTRVVMAWNG